jgi:hypothetical protein
MGTPIGAATQPSCGADTLVALGATLGWATACLGLRTALGCTPTATVLRAAGLAAARNAAFARWGAAIAGAAVAQGLGRLNDGVTATAVTGNEVTMQAAIQANMLDALEDC